MSAPEGYQPPCQRADDPDAWFIEDDGKQYADDRLVDPADEVRIMTEILDNATSYVDPKAAAMSAVQVAEARAARTALVRRRHAIDSCHVDCYMRLECLDIGLRPENLIYGVYGGYTAKQRREIVRVRDERRHPTKKES